MNKPTGKTKPLKSKPLPEFESQAQEREFWESTAHDATEYFDPSRMVVASFAKLKPSTTSISPIDGLRIGLDDFDLQAKACK